MARYLAIEWNETEARLAIAGGRPGQAIFEEAFTVSLQSPDPSEDATLPDPGERIAAALAARRIGRLPAPHRSRSREARIAATLDAAGPRQRVARLDPLSGHA